MPAQNLPPPYRQTEPNSSPVVRLEQQVSRVFDYTREKIFNRGLTFSEHHRGQVVRFEFVAPDEWAPLTLIGAWTAYTPATPPKYRWRDGFWELQQLLKEPAGALPSSGTPIAKVTGGGGLGSTETITVANNRDATVTMDAAGNIYMTAITNNVPSTGWLSLNNVRFLSSVTTPPVWGAAMQPAQVLSATFSGAPSGFLLLDVTAADGTSVGAVYPDIVAEKVGDRSPPLYRLRMRRCSGLTAGKTYALTLFVLAEPSAA